MEVGTYFDEAKELWSGPSYVSKYDKNNSSGEILWKIINDASPEKNVHVCNTFEHFINCNNWQAFELVFSKNFCDVAQKTENFTLRVQKY